MSSPYADLKVAQLKTLCSERGLLTRGNKNQLLERLRQSEQPPPLLKQEQDEHQMTTKSLLESTTQKTFEPTNIPVEQLESLPYSPDAPELMASSILQDDIDSNMDIDDSEQTPSEPMTPPLASSPITEFNIIKSESHVKSEQKLSSCNDYFTFYNDQGDKSFKSSPNDFAQIVVERKYLINPAAVEPMTRRSSVANDHGTQSSQRTAVNGNANNNFPYKYDQLFELTKHQWVYHDGETPRWFNYDTAAFAMKQPGVAVECIFRR